MKNFISLITKPWFLPAVLVLAIFIALIYYFNSKYYILKKSIELHNICQPFYYNLKTLNFLNTQNVLISA